MQGRGLDHERGRRWLALGLLAACLALAGCVFDAGEEVDPAASDADAPDAADTLLPEEITGLEHEGPAELLETAKTLWIDEDRDLAYITQNSAGFAVLNLSEPGQPTLEGRTGEGPGRDVALVEHDDGRRTAVVADSAEGMRFVDVTDPSEPTAYEATVLGRPQANVHNVAVVPNTTIVYNARSVDRPGVDIVDAADPSQPEVLTTLQTGVPCHDVAFHAPDDLATCAGVYQTQLWNVAEPTSPELLGQITNPAISIHHWAKPVQGGDLLVIGDEFLGATGPHAQGCWAGSDDPTGQGTRTDPVGALWFYDIRDPANPQLEGWLGAEEMQEHGVPPEPCTAHFGDEIADRDKILVSFIRGGVYLVDLADPSQPAILDHQPVEGESWEIRVHDGVAYNTNTDRGVDVFSFAGTGS